MTHSETLAKDLVQDIFMKLWQNHETLFQIQNVNAYLYRMAQNLAINELHRSARTAISLSSMLEPEEHTEQDTPIDALLTKDFREKLSEAVNRLPPQQQKVFTLHREQAISHAEIARELNLSVSTIENHMSQAMKNLRRYLSHVYPGLFVSLLAGINDILKLF